jgi:hypothetical protein
MQKEQLDIIQAWLDGEILQYRIKREYAWVDYPHKDQATQPPSVAYVDNWRIKPATKWWAVALYENGGIIPISRKTKDGFKPIEHSPGFKCWIFEPTEKEIPE